MSGYDTVKQTAEKHMGDAQFLIYASTACLTKVEFPQFPRAPTIKGNVPGEYLVTNAIGPFATFARFIALLMRAVE